MGLRCGHSQLKIECPPALRKRGGEPIASDLKGFAAGLDAVRNMTRGYSRISYVFNQ
jgi:hypothetical protein